jgi:hypothetical protein
MESTSSPYPRRRGLLGFVQKARANWLLRHQHPFSFWIHMIGIPLAIAGFVAMFVIDPWYWGLAGLVFGYVLQYIGHLVEGNDMGEWVAIKRLLGLPYVAVSPRYQARSNQPAG